MTIYELIQDRLDPEELIDILEIGIDELVDLLRPQIDDRAETFERIFNL